MIIVIFFLIIFFNFNLLKSEDITNSIEADKIEYLNLDGKIKAIGSVKIIQNEYELNAGFAATKHKTEFQSLLALPFFLSSMLIIAAPFSVRFIRSESVNNLILAGVISGLILYTFSNVIYAFGASGNIGPILSAWSPPILAILLGISAIIYIEEG